MILPLVQLKPPANRWTFKSRINQAQLLTLVVALLARPTVGTRFILSNWVSRRDFSTCCIWLSEPSYTPNSVYASNKGSGEFSHMHRLARAYAADDLCRRHFQMQFKVKDL